MSTQYISWPPPRTASGITSINSEVGDVTIVAGAGISVVPSGTNITITNTATHTFPDGSVLSGTYDGDVIIDGSASLGADVTVSGDLVVKVNLTNTGGFALTVNGDCIINQAMLFTPTSLATTQGNVVINGDFLLGGQLGPDSFFQVNPGQAPNLLIGGSVVTFEQNFFGNGQAEAQGLVVTISGDCSDSVWVLTGGDSAGTADSGAGGSFVAFGAVANSNADCSGGSSSHNGFKGGDGGQIQVRGPSTGCNYAMNGGNSTDQNGGNPGTFLSADVNLLSFSATGGNSSGGGNGGNGGMVSVQGSFACSGTVTLAPGTGVSPGTTGVMDVIGNWITTTATTIDANTTVKGSFTVKGDLTLTANLTVTGSRTVTGTYTPNGHTSTVLGAITFPSGIMDINHNVAMGLPTLSTTATNGFFFIPLCAGPPVGTPTGVTGYVPMVYDTADNTLYIYNSGWKSVVLA